MKHNTPAQEAKSLGTLFFTFFKIGLFTFGGGYALIPLIQAEVERHANWQIGRPAFLDLLTLAKAIEPNGDHAKNIAEFIIYIVKGAAVRHGALEQVEQSSR